MKIKGIFVIPLIAILVAMLTVGTIPGFASDTTASEVTTSDTLTYVPPSFPPTSSFDEELGGFISDALGDDLQQAEGPIRGFSELMAGILNSFKNFLNNIIRIFEFGGGMLGDGGSLGSLGDIAGGLLG